VKDIRCVVGSHDIRKSIDNNTNMIEGLRCQRCKNWFKLNPIWYPCEQEKYYHLWPKYGV